ncbi:hypothetical protein GCM10029964_065140 [Kibdelosporangium lantanae]
MANRAPRGDEADYVVVGSGSSGAAVAGRLAESGARVIVLEAGGSDEKLLVRKPGMVGPMHAVPQLKRIFDWGYYSVPQKHLLDRRMPVPRGKVLGGSSSVNGMVYVRGNRANYDSWAAEGNKGWDADSVNTVYKRFEDFEDGENTFRGAGGPIRVTRARTPQEGSLQFLQATADTVGCEILDDYNAESQEGVSRMQQNAAGGLRYSTSRGYIHHLAPRPSRSSPGYWRKRWSSRTAARPVSRSSTPTAPSGRSVPARRSSSPPGSSGPRSCSCCPVSATRNTCGTTASPCSRTYRSVTTCTTTCSTR